MIGQGLTLTVIGMAIVFLFLTILVVLMVLMSGIAKGIIKRRVAKEGGTESPVAGAVPAEIEKTDDYSDIAAALGAYLRAGGILPASTGKDREDVAAALAAVAAAGGPLPRGNYREIAAAIAAVRAYK